MTNAHAETAAPFTELSDLLQTLGIVVIGRNEGDRLRRSLESLRGHEQRVVYVDSGSVDGSPQLARELGFEVLELDPSKPFTAARGRNAGFERMLKTWPDLRFVQFIDGDCELVAGWLETAVQAVQAHEDWAIVAGRVRERNRDATIYNRLCDLEWDTPVGECSACGGIALMRVSALRAVGGFDASVIAAEEDELCVRLRMSGWRIVRLARDMVWHDAAMTRFSQWWKRAERSGHAFAQGAQLHGHTPLRHFVRERRSIWVWGLVVPALGAGLSWPTSGLSLLILCLYPVLIWRVYRAARLRGFAAADAALFGAHCVLAKFPQLFGAVRFHMNQLRGRPSSIIEHKQAATPQQAS